MSRKLHLAKNLALPPDAVTQCVTATSGRDGVCCGGRASSDKVHEFEFVIGDRPAEDVAKELIKRISELMHETLR